MTRTQASPKTLPLDAMPCIFPNAAGLDIGSTEIIAAHPPDRAPQPVRAFGTFSPDLHVYVVVGVARESGLIGGASVMR